ncbi:MAG: hypothetical protein QG575_290 [Euryarchaeota archaeon]|nr:hypothetical protein [Euryarchaeota archaeon]
MSQYWLFAQRLGLIAATNLLISLSGLILLPILTKSIPVEDYGVWVQVGITAELIPLAVTLGLPYALVRFLPVSLNDKEETRQKFYAMLFIVVLTALITSLLMYYFSEDIAEILFDGQTIVVKLTSIIVFIECLNVMFFNLLRASQQIKKYSIFTMAKSYLSIAIVAFFIFNNQGISGAVIGLLLAELILFALFLLSLVSNLGFAIPTFKGTRDYLAFGIPIVPWYLSNWIINSSDRYVISIFLGTTFVGYYSPGYTIGNITMMFVAPFTFMLPVVLSKYYDEGNIQEVKMVLSHSLKYFLAIAIPSIFGLSLLSRPILQVMSTPEIASQGYLITPFVALSGLMFGCYTIIAQILVLEKAMKITSLIWSLIAVENLAMTVILVPKVGIIGAAITTLVTFASAFVAVAYFSLKRIQFDIDLVFILKCVIASALMSAVMLFWKPVGILEILGEVLLCASIYVILIFALQGFRKEEIKFFRSLLQRGA